MSLPIVWFSVLVILSNFVLENVKGQSAQPKDSSTVFPELKALTKAVAILQAKIELQTTTLTNLEAKADIQDSLLNNLATIASTQAILLNKLDAKVDVQANSLRNLQAQYTKQINSLNEMEANLEIQVAAFNNVVDREEWQEPIAQSPTNRTIVALEGDDVEMACVVHGTPLPEIRWTKETRAHASDRMAVETTGKVLRIKNVQSSDKGSYVCVAANGIGTPGTQSIYLEVYGKYQQCNRMFESDKGILKIGPSSTSCLIVIKLQNTTGFRLQLDPLMTQPILAIPEPSPSNSSFQAIQLSGSKNGSQEFNVKSLGIVVPRGLERWNVNWTGLATDDSQVSSSTKYLNDDEGTLEWESSCVGTDKIFWAIDFEMNRELNWTLSTGFTAQDQENPCENIYFSILQIWPDGHISEIHKTCDGSSEGSLKLEISSQVMVLLHIKSVNSSKSKLRVSWAHHDEPLKKIVDGIVAGTNGGGAFAVPFNSGQTKLVPSGYIYGMTFDWDSQKIYYLKSKALMQSKLDGSESKILISGSSSWLFGLMIEPTTGNLYFGDRTSKSIRVCNNDVNKCSTVANSSDLSNVYDIAVHRSKGLLFWSIWDQNIVRANLDGSNATVVLQGYNVRGIDVDEHADRLYWGSFTGIGSCDLNGQDIQMLPSLRVLVTDVAIDNDRVYYTDRIADNIHVISKSGTNKRLVAQLRHWIFNIALFGTQVSNQPANPCKKSKCAHLCVLVTRWSYRCSCPENQQLTVDGITCTF